METNLRSHFGKIKKGGDIFYTTRGTCETFAKFCEKFKGKIIWCPFDTKNSFFVIVLRERGHKVIHSHIDDGQDFFDYEPKHWDILISNPPWSIKWKVLERVLSFQKPFALLLPIYSLSTKVLFKMFGKNNDLQFIIPGDNISFLKGDNKEISSAPFGSSFFCWKFLDKPIVWGGFKRETKIKKSNEK